MAWDDTPPTPQDLASNPMSGGGGWDTAPPTAKELGDQVGTTPPDVAMKQDMYGPGLQDATVNDGMMWDGITEAPFLAKNVAGIAAKGVGAALDAIPATENVLPTMDRIANNYTLKSFGGSPGQIQKMAAGRGGREALDEAARYARDKGLGDVWSTSIGREKQLAALKDASGKTIGALRDEAGEGPKTSELVKDAIDKFGPKYNNPGIHAGQGGEFQQALDEVNKLSPVREIPQSEKIGSYLEDNPESSTHNINVSEPNPLYTNVPENIKPGLNTASPITKDPRMIDLKLNPKGAPASPEFPLSYKNPMFLSDEPSLAREVQLETHPYENARHSSEDFDAPDYDVSGPPSHAAIADKMTELNKHATDLSGMLRPNSATTDVTDLISARNNQEIAQKLGSTKAKQYVDALDEQSQLHPLEHLQTKGELREAGGRGSMFDKIKDKFGYRAIAKNVANLHDALKGSPLSDYVARAGQSGIRVSPAMAAYIKSKLKEQNED